MRRRIRWHVAQSRLEHLAGDAMRVAQYFYLIASCKQSGTRRLMEQ
jgi:hypothetical protein